MNERHKMETMALLSDNLMGFINPYAEVYALTAQIAPGGLTYMFYYYLLYHDFLLFHDFLLYYYLSL